MKFEEELSVSFLNMETFYDGDLKDIWDSDLDPTESLKISTDSDMHDWFLERDVKDPVILNDRLISDALLNGTLPIKSEHSYSLNSDGDSLPDSPRSLSTRMDDLEDDCYPAISLKSATSNCRNMDIGNTIDPKCLTIPATTSIHCSPVVVTTLATTIGASNTVNAFVTSTPATSLSSHMGLTFQNTICSTNTVSGGGGGGHNSNNQSGIYVGSTKLTSAPMTINLRNLEKSRPATHFTKRTLVQTHKQQQKQYLPQKLSSVMENICSSPTSSTYDGSTSPDICSDIEIDESCIKEEPLSPDSSCPPSPRTQATNSASLSLSMANMAAFTNSDLVFEHKNGCLQLTPASQSLLKSQQLIMGATPNNSQNILIPKFNIKTETACPNGGGSGTFVSSTTARSGNKNGNGTTAYGLPLTPPSSLPSDESEGNLTPEHLLSPLSPCTSVSISVAPTVANVSQHNVPAVNARRSTNSMSSSASASASASSASASASTSNANCHSSTGRNMNGGSTRQPIHTPLISSQPKGSTGTLILTEEEKRTLLAEGYPIPQKLPLTKAEEKSLKKIRRKIKNKISAQESRRKKKEYMDQLERRVEILVSENTDYRKRVESLEDSNASLLSQLHKLQALVAKQNPKKP